MPDQHAGDASISLEVLQSFGFIVYTTLRTTEKANYIKVNI
jgi:hypothetical protein